MLKPINKQVIVVTGASSGIGLTTAKEAARRGAKVVLAARNENDLNRAVEEIRQEGGDAMAVPTDVTGYEQVENLARRAVEAYGRIDTWVNNAAVSHYAPFKEMNLDDFRRVWETIFMGQVHGAKVALPLLEKTDGALICVGSVLSDRSVPLQSSYCAAKHALKGWLEALRLELAHEGSKVRVTLVKPSSINTPLFKKAKTQLGVEPMPVPPIYEPELAAAEILRAAESREREVFVGGMGKGLSVAQRISPRLVDLQLLRSGFKKQKTNWPKGADAPNNLYEPVAHDGGMYGDFSDRAKGSSTYQKFASNRVAIPMQAAAGLGLGAWLAAKGTKGKTLPVLLGVGALFAMGKGLVTLFSPK